MVFTSAQTIPVLFQLASSGGKHTLAFLHSSDLIHHATVGLFILFFCFLDYTNTSVLNISLNGLRLGFSGHLKGHNAQNEMEGAFC